MGKVKKEQKIRKGMDKGEKGEGVPRPHVGPIFLAMIQNLPLAIKTAWVDWWHVQLHYDYCNIEGHCLTQFKHVDTVQCTVQCARTVMEILMGLYHWLPAATSPTSMRHPLPVSVCCCQLHWTPTHTDVGSQRRTTAAVSHRQTVAEIPEHSVWWCRTNAIWNSFRDQIQQQQLGSYTHCWLSVCVLCNNSRHCICTVCTTDKQFPTKTIRNGTTNFSQTLTPNSYASVHIKNPVNRIKLSGMVPKISHYNNWKLVSKLEFNVPVQYKYGYIRDERSGMDSYPYPLKEG